VLKTTPVSGVTLCPFGQSKKAIGYESRIGPCVATHSVDNRQACRFQKTNGAVTTVQWNHRGEETLLRFARGDETGNSVCARPLSEGECTFKQLG
jgi:hypothetical protein